MRYTLWLNGHLLGETRLEHRGPGPSQRLGGLKPTLHGLEILPNLCGFLSAAAAVKKALGDAGVSDPDEESERTMQLLASTPEGARFTELVKQLGQLELRETGGDVAPFHTIIITDISELGTLSDQPELEAEASNGPRFIVSATQTNFRTASSVLRAPTVRMRIKLEPN